MPLKNTPVFHAFSDAKACIQQEMKVVLRAYPIQRMVWERPGCFLKVLSWMEESKVEVTEPVMQIRSSVFGAVFG